MRKNLVYFILVISLVSCQSDDGGTIPSETIGSLLIEDIHLGNQYFRKLSGSIDQDILLTSNTNWLLDGSIFVMSGATLSIEAGTTVYAGFNENTSFLSVLRGGSIICSGTKEAPIIFTSIRKLTSVPQPGDWGGLIVNGYAPINLPGGEGEGEGGTGTYGGNLPNDNSGVIRYTIIEYGGKSLGADNELNGLSLNGVGNATTVEFVESLYGLDDGIEMFGGTVNLRYIVSLGNGDDSFDWTYGWNGFGQFWVAQQDPFDGDRGIEADNNEDTPNAIPISNPTVTNVTLVGASDGDPDNSGIVLRHGTKGSIYNALVTNFSNSGVKVGDTSQDFIETSELNFYSSLVYLNGAVDSSAPDFENADAFRDDITNQTNANLFLDGFIGTIDSDFDPITIDDWFLSAPYIGAVPTNNDWTAQWINPLR